MCSATIEFETTMKKIITPGVREESELICDITGEPAVAKLVMTFGYGSQRDMDLLNVDLSSEVAEEVLKLLQSKYPQFQPEEQRDGWVDCPFCNKHW
jgi:hypothetical protein